MAEIIMNAVRVLSIKFLKLLSSLSVYYIPSSKVLIVTELVAGPLPTLVSAAMEQ